jgi:hypothetical protein
MVSNKAAYNNKIIKIKGQVETIHIPTGRMILIATAALIEEYSCQACGVYYG